MNEGFVKEFEDKLRKPLVLRVGEGEASEPVVVVPPGWVRLPHDIPHPAEIVVHKLASIRDYLELNVDGLDKSKLMLQVTTPVEVGLLRAIEGPETRFRRQMLLRAEAMLPVFPFGTFLPHEEFMVRLQSMFVPTPERDDLLTTVSAISESAVRTTREDGFAQEVNVSKGVQMVGAKRLPNPVNLRPYRTFPEIEQPESPFVVRARQAREDDERPQLALFESDGGAWRMSAMDALGVWLRDTVGAEVGVLS